MWGLYLTRKSVEIKYNQYSSLYLGPLIRWLKISAVSVNLALGFGLKT